MLMKLGVGRVMRQGVVIPNRCCSHSCNQGQEAVKGSRAVFAVSQAVKDISNSVTAVKIFTFCACILYIV